MNKTYYKNENKYLYFGISIAALIVFIVGINLVDLYLWILIPAILFMAIKGIQIHKTPATAVLKIDQKGLTIINKKSGNKYYSFKDIEFIKMNSKSLNGHLKIKNQKKKIILDSVAIDLNDQQEIVEVVNNKIFSDAHI